METKHTPGEWIETAGPEAKYWLVGVPNNNGFSTVATISATIDGTSLANAQLIAEAGTVTNETGYTPRQLAEQKAELLYIVSELAKKSFRNKGARKFADYSVSSSLIDKAAEAIKKLTQ